MRRRDLLKAALGSSALSILPRRTDALMFLGRGGGGGPIPAQLATLTLVNTSASPVASGSVTPIFGWAFKEGDIPAAATATGSISGSGSTTLTVSGVTGTIAAGQLIAGGAGSIPANTTVSSVAGSTVTMSQASTAALSGGSLIFAGAPQFLVSGTPQPYSWGLQNFYPDGSLCRASFMLRTTASIAGSGSLAVGVYNNGSAPSPATGRSLTELQGQGIVTSVTGAAAAANLSGTWTASIDGTQVASYVYMDGAAGRVWRIETQFEQSSSPHGQLYCYHYVAALQDGSGNLLGYRYLADITQPWYNVNSPTKAIRLLTGVETTWSGGSGGTHALQFPHTSRTFTTSASSTTCIAGSSFDWVTGSGGGSASGAGSGGTINVIPGYITVAGGSMDSALSANTLYFANVSSSSLTRFTLQSANTSSQDVGITMNGDATGTMTFNPAPMVEHFGHLYMLSATAQWQYIQADGSLSADATIRTQYDATYFHATGLLPPFATSPLGGPVTDCSALWTAVYPNWSPCSIGPCNSDVGDYGAAWTIGVVTNNASVHFLNQSAAGEQANRTLAYAGQNCYLSSVRESTYKNFQTVNNQSYTGMAASSAGFYWIPGSVAASFTAPPANNNAFTIYEADSSHKPSWVYYAALVFGNPEFIDASIEQALVSINGLQTVYRNLTAGPGEPLYGLVTASAGGGHVRTIAWAARELFHGHFIVPKNHPDGSQISQYIEDLATANANYPITVLSATWLNQYCVDVGLWLSVYQYSPLYVDDLGGTGFMNKYMGATMAIAAGGRMQNTAAQQFCQQIATYFIHKLNVHGGWHLYSEIDHSAQAPYITAYDFASLIAMDAQWGAKMPGAPMNWQSSFYAGTSCYFQRASAQYLYGWVPANGDVWIFDGTATSNPMPSNFTIEGPYYVRDLVLSGSDYYYNLALAPTGAPDWSASTSYATNTFVQPTSGNAGNYVYVQIKAAGGTAGGSAPTWPQTVGNTVSDGTLTWYCLGTSAVLVPANSATAGVVSGPWISIVNPPAATTGDVADGIAGAQSYLTNLDTMSAYIGAVAAQQGFSLPAGFGPASTPGTLRYDSTKRMSVAGTSFVQENNWAMQDTF